MVQPQPKAGILELRPGLLLVLQSRCGNWWERRRAVVARLATTQESAGLRVAPPPRQILRAGVCRICGRTEHPREAVRRKCNIQAHS